MSVNPIKVGWDYDEPIHPWHFGAHTASVAAGLVPHGFPETPRTWAPHEEYGVPLDDWIAVLDSEVLKGDDGMYMLPLDEDVKWQLHRIANAGFENSVVTARGSFGIYGHLVRDLTLRHIEREGLPVTNVRFAADKVNEVNDLGLDYFIDDAPHNYEDLVKYCPNTEVYLYDAPWNQDLVVPEGRRLFSVEEYVDIILSKHAPVLAR